MGWITTHSLTQGAAGIDRSKSTGHFSSHDIQGATHQSPCLEETFWCTGGRFGRHSAPRRRRKSPVERLPALVIRLQRGLYWACHILLVPIPGWFQQEVLWPSLRKAMLDFVRLSER